MEVLQQNDRTVRQMEYYTFVSTVFDGVATSAGIDILPQTRAEVL